MTQQKTDVPEMSVELLHEHVTLGTPLQLIDVRESSEWAEGHIAGARHIPLAELPRRLGEIDRSRDVAFICHLGGRSEMATRLARQCGLSSATNVTGGMEQWLMRGYPVEL